MGRGSSYAPTLGTQESVLTQSQIQQQQDAANRLKAIELARQGVLTSSDNPFKAGTNESIFFESLSQTQKNELTNSPYLKAVTNALIVNAGGLDAAINNPQTIISNTPVSAAASNPTSYEAYQVLHPGTGGLGAVIGDIGDTVKNMGPMATIIGNAILPGLGTALSVAAAIDEGADPVDIAKNIAIGEIVNQVGVGSEITDSAVAADLVDNTLKGLLTGQDLDSALTNAVVSSVAGEVTNQTKDDFQADVDTVLDSPASTPVSDFLSDVNEVLDLPVTPEIPPEQIMVTETPPDIPAAPTLDEIIQQFTPEVISEVVPETIPEPVSGQDLAADAIPGNTIADIVDTLPSVTEPQLPPAPTEPGLTKAQVETLIKTALAATAADQVVNQPEPQKTGFDLVPVPTDWSSPVYDQSFTPVDLDSIFQNLQGMQTQWKPRPNITGGAYMGSPVNISDIVNQIMGSELTPQSMPTNITNAVGGILGSSTTR